MKGSVVLIILILSGIISAYKKRNKLNEVREERNKIKRLEYYFILEEENLSYYETRKENSKVLFDFYIGCCATICFILILLAHILNLSSDSLFFLKIITYILFACAVVGILLYFKLSSSNYLVMTCLFYATALSGVLLLTLEEYSSKIEYTYILIMLCLVLYLILILIYPAPYLRRLDTGITLWLPIIVCVVSILSYMGMVKDGIASLLTSLYAIGIFLVKVKLKLLESKADDIYDGILKRRFSPGVNLRGEEYEYNECKRCVFFGGKKFKEKILGNEELYKLINEIESNNITSKKSKMSAVKERLKNMISN